MQVALTADCDRSEGDRLLQDYHGHLPPTICDLSSRSDYLTTCTIKKQIIPLITMLLTNSFFGGWGGCTIVVESVDLRQLQAAFWVSYTQNSGSFFLIERKKIY